jgi:PAS domain S-box-containing protein
MYRQRQFLQEEIELLEAIGNQIGVAIEKARLYRYQRQVAEQLRASEKRYRDLFENAYDAIWLHDLEDNILAANRACIELSGYSLEELSKLKSDRLFAEDDLITIKQIEHNLVMNNNPGSIVEAKLIKKDRSEAFVQLFTNLIFGDGQPPAIQHIARDVTMEKRMQENLRFYVQQATRAQEEERKRIARELHDDTIQALVAHARNLDQLAVSSRNLSPQDLQRVENLIAETNSIMQGVRRLSQDLRPAILDRLGLLPALEWLASDMTKYSGISVEVKMLGTERRLPSEVEVVLFRIAQEALRNIWKHSQATKAEVLLEFGEGKIKVCISDNGKGFEIPQRVGDLARSGKLGLTGMQERARLIGGDLDIKSEKGKGTIITVKVSAQQVSVQP